MNYYERYCGDYARDTAHLSLEEHGAYTIMLDTFYSTERPLPADYDSLYRICRAMTKTEQASVRAVADQFFPVGEDGLRRNDRADEELQKALKRIGTARVNGSKGGRPRKPAENPSGFPDNPIGLFDENPPDNPLETQRQSSPHTIPHTPPKARSTTTPTSVGFERFWDAWPAHKRKADKAGCFALWTRRDLEPETEDILAHVAACRRSIDWTKDDGQFIPAPIVYLRNRRFEAPPPSAPAPKAEKRVAL